MHHEVGARERHSVVHLWPFCPALRIHMSDSTAEILKRLGDYDLECRGEREVKVRVCGLHFKAVLLTEYNWSFSHFSVSVRLCI